MPALSQGHARRHGPPPLRCAANGSWATAYPGNPQAQLFYVPGRAIYRSMDKGQNLQLEQTFQNLEDYEAETASNTLIIAASMDSI